MKNLRLLVAVWAVLMIAAPAMALDVEISGHYFVEHYNNSNIELSKDDATDDYGSMELMVKPVFKVNDNITITTQFTALESHVWGTDPSEAETSTIPWPLPDGTTTTDNGGDFDWKAAYMTLKTPIGGFIIGRYIDTPWGLGLGDSTASHGSNDRHKDRIMWVIPIGDFISGAVYQRNEENDKGNVRADQDFIKAYVFSAYKQENWSAGLLFANYQHKEYLSSKNLAYAATSLGLETLGAPYAPVFGPQLGTGSWAGDSNAYYDTRGELELWVLDPYFKGQFGPLGIQAEMLYGWGDVDQNSQGTDDIDAEGMAYFVDLSWDFGIFKVWGGTTFVQGDTDYTDDEANCTGYFEPSVDHERGFLLTSDTSELERTLGGTATNAAWNGTGFNLGNMAGGPGTVSATAGYQSYYIGADWKVLENLTLSCFFVTMEADDPPSTNPLNAPALGPDIEWDDDIGTEYDLTITWDIMDNLRFQGIVAHLDAGDYWKQGDDTADIKDNTTLYGQLMVEF